MTPHEALETLENALVGALASVRKLRGLVETKEVSPTEAVEEIREIAAHVGSLVPGFTITP